VLWTALALLVHRALTLAPHRETAAREQRPRHDHGIGGIAWLRDAAWLGRGRAIAYSKIAVFAFAIIASAWVYAGDRLIDPRGKPVGATS